MSAASLDEIKRRLVEFAQREAVGYSPLYEHLAASAAEDDDIAGLLTATDGDDARPTLLLAAAHRLVIREPVSDLAEYYPSVGGANGVDGQVWRTFREFVMDRADRMRELVATRHTQTNEVMRTALVYPALTMAAREAGGPIGLLEVGCSAGLLLGADTYGYRYQLGEADQINAGPVRSPLVLSTDLELADGVRKPKIPKKLNVSAKVGLDRAPVDVGDDDELAWLEACIWADQPERLRRFGLAANMLRRKPPELVAGDAIDDLAAAAGRVPEHLPLVALTSHVLAYLNEQRRADFVAALEELAARRPVWWVTQEAHGAGVGLVTGADPAPPADGPLICSLGLVRFTGGRADGELLAHTTGHGDRMKWLV
jgi:hypothetical protein